jgi:hypothetical protein
MLFSFIIWFYQMQTISNLEPLEAAITELWQIWFPLSILVSLIVAYLWALIIPYKRDNSDISQRRITFGAWGILTAILHYSANHFYHRSKIISEELITDWDKFNLTSTLALFGLYLCLGLALSKILRSQRNKFGTIWPGN